MFIFTKKDLCNTKDLLAISRSIFFGRRGCPVGGPDSPCMKKSIVGGSEGLSF